MSGVRPPAKLVTLREPALPPRLFTRLAEAVGGLGSEALHRTYQTTFWFDLRLDARGVPSAEPEALPEQAALRLWPQLPAHAGVVGVEWWLSRMRTTDVQVDFHRDRDERRAVRGGRTFHPRVSSVLFLNEVRGGALAVTRADPCPTNPSLAPDTLDLELVAPRPNRIAFFAGSLTHGVLDRDNQIPDGKLRGREPLRLAVIFNWWSRRPEATPRLSEATDYRTLRLPRAARARAASRP